MCLRGSPVRVLRLKSCPSQTHRRRVPAGCWPLYFTPTLTHHTPWSACLSCPLPWRLSLRRVCPSLVSSARWRRTLTADPTSHTQAAFALLFDDAGAFVTSLHASVTKDPNATVTPWACASQSPLKGDANTAASTCSHPGAVARRVVRFTKGVDVPAVVARLLGDVSKLTVDDVTTLHPADAVHPLLGTPGALPPPAAATRRRRSRGPKWLA